MNVASLSRKVRAIKQKNRTEPAIPIDNSFILPEEYKRTSTGDLFLIDDNQNADDRILIFAADWALDLLETSNHWGESFKLSISLKFLG